MLISFVTLSTQARDLDCQAKWDGFQDSKMLQNKYRRVTGLCNLEAKQALESLVRRHSSISYKAAKKKMFGRIDNHHGEVCSVYSEHCLRTNKVPNNTEQMTFTIDKDNRILFNWEKTLLLIPIQ